jgi:hypothetical protein
MGDAVVSKRYTTALIPETELSPTLNDLASDGWRLKQAFERKSANVNNPGMVNQFYCILEKEDDRAPSI